MENMAMHALMIISSGLDKYEAVFDIVLAKKVGERDRQE
jgi:hypothetical protein